VEILEVYFHFLQDLKGLQVILQHLFHHQIHLLMQGHYLDYLLHQRHHQQMLLLKKLKLNLDFLY